MKYDQQTSFSSEDAKALLNQLIELCETLRQEWSMVLNQWGNLKVNWRDEQFYKFEHLFEKISSTYAKAQRECEEYIAFLQEQIRIAGDRQQKLGDLLNVKVRGAAIANSSTGDTNSSSGSISGGSGSDSSISPPNKVPQGLTEEQFALLSSLIRQGAGYLGDDIRVHGSRAAGTARNDSDIDIAIRVSPEKFDQLINERFGTPNPGSAKEKTKLRAIETGKIQSGELGLRGLRRATEKQLGIEIDISVIQIESQFDRGPWIGL